MLIHHFEEDYEKVFTKITLLESGKLIITAVYQMIFNTCHTLHYIICIFMALVIISVFTLLAQLVIQTNLVKMVEHASMPELGN